MSVNGDELSSTGRKRPRTYLFKRASKACDQCRISKTRCQYLNNGINCFRCKNLSLNCSLGTLNSMSNKKSKQKNSDKKSSLKAVADIQDYDSDNEQDDDGDKEDDLGNNRIRDHHELESRWKRQKKVKLQGLQNTDHLVSINKKLDNIQSLLSNFVTKKQPLDQSQRNVSGLYSPLPPPNNNHTPKSSIFELLAKSQSPDVISNENVAHQQSQSNDPLFFNRSPFNDIKEASSKVRSSFSKELAFDYKPDLNLSQLIHRYDLITRNVISFENCVLIFQIFMNHYGKWISLQDFTTYDELLGSIRSRSPLLLSICILLGLRHLDCEKYKLLKSIDQHLEFEILQIIQQLMSLTTYELPQTKEFMQSMVLLTNSSLSLTYEHIYFDGWWLSSYGLIHFVTREMNVNLFLQPNNDPEKIINFRLWNHLSVNHLMYCILSGRPCMIDELRLDQCRDILELVESTAFDGSIVAQLSIILSLYNCLQYQEGLKISEKELTSTFNDWKYLTEQKPIGETILIVYSFSKVMVYRRFVIKKLNEESNVRLTDEYKSVLSSLIESCFEVMSSGCKLTKDELISTSDVILSIFITTMIVILEIKESKDLVGSFDLLDHNDNIKMLKTYDSFLELFGFLKENLNYFNSFPENFTNLVKKSWDNKFSSKAS